MIETGNQSDVDEDEGRGFMTYSGTRISDDNLPPEEKDLTVAQVFG